MAFVRIKKIKNKEYAYLVENRWTNKGARQKSIGYLGKVIRLNKRKNPLSFDEYIKKENIILENLSTKEIALNLIKLELINHNFKGKENHFMENKEIRFNLTDFSVKQQDKPVVIHLNESFMCNHNISRLLNFSEEGDEDKVGFELAKAFVDAGITVPKELFVSMFERLYKPDSRAKIK